MPSQALIARRRLVLACPAAGIWGNFAGSLGLGGDRMVALRLQTTGTVLAADPQARLMKVQTQRGEITFRLDPKVQNLDDIKVGGVMRVDYVASLVLTHKRGAEPRQPQRAGRPGESLAAAYSRPIVFTTEILAVDRDKQTVRLKGPAGEEGEFRVSNETDLDGMRPGDQLLASMNQAVAISVAPVMR